MDQRALRGWTWYDWANSVFPLVISTAIFPAYYDSVTRDMTLPLKGSVIYEIVVASAFIVIALLSPILSGLADLGGKKAKYMERFCYVGAAACATLFFFDSSTLWLGLLCVFVANIGFSGSIVFYNAFLPELAPHEMHDKVSAKGFALGYVGSSLLLILCLLFYMNHDFFGIQQSSKAAQLCFLVTGIWWVGFSQITFRRLPAEKPINANSGSWKAGWQEIAKVWQSLKVNPQLKRYLIAFFFFNMALQTVMYVAALFGAGELQLSTDLLIMVMLIIQFVAVAGSYFFSWVSAKTGNINSLVLCSVIWVLVCIFAFLIPPKAPGLFCGLAALVGFVMGGGQSMSRSTYAKLLPETKDHASYFSFFDVANKFGVVAGMLLYAVLEQMVSVRVAVLALMILFLAGLAFFKWVPIDQRIQPQKG